jgi:hypothetical protein
LQQAKIFSLHKKIQTNVLEPQFSASLVPDPLDYEPGGFGIAPRAPKLSQPATFEVPFSHYV